MIWQMNGVSQISSAVLGPNPGAAWHIRGAGDFNNDGHADIVWQNNDGSVAIWDMNGASIIGAAVIANPGPSWHLAAAADFSGDGSSDLLFQNNDGSVAIWQMNGTSLVSGAVLAANPGSAWHIKGTGDFNNDGHADIVWQHNDGTVAVWSMASATTLLAGPTTGIVAAPGPAWQIGGVGDYNGDGVSDIILQNTGSGQAALWTMNGADLTPTGALLSANPGTSWHMVG